MSKNVRRAGSIAAVVGIAALIAPAFAVAQPATGSFGSSSGTCAAVSTETNPNGWGNTFSDEKTQLAAYSATNVIDQDGSIKLEVKTTADREAHYHTAGISLADAAKKEIGFAEKRVGDSVASFQLRLTGTTGGTFQNGFTTLVWTADAVNVTAGVTHTNIQAGKWWSTQSIAGAPKGVPVTLAAIIAANPNAKVDHYGVSLGSGFSEAITTNIDTVKFNGCSTNFALKDAGPLGSLGSIFGS